jgi:hypothetical protein
MRMIAVLISVAVAIMMFAGGIAGLFLQRLLPDHHTSERSRDMIGAVVGLVTLELALVLGTLIGSAFGFYSTQKSELETLAARSLQLDMALVRYGPEAQPLRAGMRQEIDRAYRTFWGGGDIDAKSLHVAALLPSLRALEDGLDALKPATEAQKQLVANAGAQAGLIEQTRLLMTLQLASPISWPLLVIVVSWSVFLFCGFGLLSRINSTTIAALGVGAFGVASAIFLILELSEPYTGLFPIPPAALEQTLEALNP